jgi:hypothetical protein
VIVLFNWRAIWMCEWTLTDPAAPQAATFALRRLFGDVVGLGLLAALVGGGLVLMLGGWRLIRALPVETRPPTSASPESSSVDASSHTLHSS